MSNAHIFPQYAVNTSQKAHDDFDALESSWEAFHEAVRELSQRITGDPHKGVIRGGRVHGAVMVGLPRQYDGELPGKWKKPDGMVREPYRSNPISREFDAVRHDPPQIAGRPSFHMGEGRMGPGVIFRHNGAIYSGFGFQTTAERIEDPADNGWQEIKASEFHRAREEYTEAKETP